MWDMGDWMLTSDQPPVFQAGQGSVLHTILSTGLSALLHSVPSLPSSEGHATIRRMKPVPQDFEHWHKERDYYVRFEVLTVVTMKNAVSLMGPSVDPVRTGVSEERSTSIIRVQRISELGTMLAVTSN
jgi:hypothetical protein